MADRDQIRKIQFTGKSSYIVSLPKDWIKDQGLKQGDQVTVGRNGSTILEVKPVSFGKTSGDESSNLIIAPEDEKSTIVRKLIALYFLNSKTINVKPKTSSLIPTGLSIAFSENYEIQIRPRSGLAAKKNISVLNTPGTIDSDYRGEIKVIIYNHGQTDFIVNNGDRIAQMVLSPVIKMELNETDNLPETIRGEGGFGSTGK